MAGRSEPVARDRVAQLAQLRLGQARARPARRPPRRARSRRSARPPRNRRRAGLWFTCSAEYRVAERAQRVPEAGRVGAARDEAADLAAGLDQPVPADVLLDALAQRRRVHALILPEERRGLAAELRRKRPDHVLGPASGSCRRGMRPGTRGESTGAGPGGRRRPSHDASSSASQRPTQAASTSRSSPPHHVGSARQASRTASAASSSPGVSMRARGVLDLHVDARRGRHTVECEQQIRDRERVNDRQDRPAPAARSSACHASA